MLNYTEISLKFYGSISKIMKAYFIDIKDDMHRANMKYTLEEWISKALFTSSLVFVLSASILSFGFGFFTSPIVAAFSALTLSATFSGILFFVFYSYPTTLSRVRENKIKKVLPFSVSYLASIANSKVSGIVLFKTISQFKEYTEVSNEAKNIVRDVEVFGMPLTTAIKNQAKRTPSKEFRELLWGINSITVSGGDLGIFLKQKSDELMNDYRRRIRKYAQDLSLFVEVYLTLIVTGSIFFVVLSSIIATLSGGMGTILVQTFVVFLLIPILSIGFIIIIKSISPLE
jgi:flagellar protein FlaJ